MPHEREESVIYLRDRNRSQYDVISVHHTWQITNFSMCLTPLLSTTFGPQSNQDYKFMLEVNPCYLSHQKVFTSVLFLNVGAKSGTHHRLEVSIIQRSGETTHTKTCVWLSLYFKPLRTGILDYIERSVLLDEQSELLCEDALTLLCRLSLRTEVPEDTVRVNITEWKAPECHLADDLGRLLENGTGSDVVFTVEAKEIHAHKNILMARSSVFSAMFSSDRQEKSTGRVKITDVSHQVLLQMLRFVYTGKEPEQETVTCDLLVAADRYDLIRLKTLCQETLCSQISVNTAADMFRLAATCCARQVQSYTLDFISGHMQEVIETTGWKTLVKEEPHLHADVIEQIGRPP